MKTVIGRQDYHVLLGLQVVADRHDRAIKDIAVIVGEITGDPYNEGDGSHAEDFAFGAHSESVQAFLARLKIAVEE